MTNYRLGEIVLLAFPQTDLRTTSKRPALVLFDAGDRDVMVSRITSQPHSGQTDYNIGSWEKAGLLFASWVRLGKMATLEKTLIERKLGKLDSYAIKKIKDILKEMFKIS